MPSRGGRGGGRGGRDREPLPRSVQVSKKLSWLLRHGAESEGLTLLPGGFLNLKDVLENRKIRGLKPTFEEIQELVRDNDKQRFTMAPVSAVSAQGIVTEEAMNGGGVAEISTKPQDWLIRANQGHSIKVEDEGLLTPITLENAPEVAVHGTTHAAWTLIVPSGGLKKMNRNHVHLASGLPAGFKSLAQEENASAVEAPVISGMRKTSTVLMFLDVEKALESGLKLWKSDNGVILTEGDAEGLVKLGLFKRVEDRTGEGVLLEDGKIVKETPASWAGKGKGSGGRG